MSQKHNFFSIILITISILCIWLTKSFILFIVFNSDVKSISFADLISLLKELNIPKIMSFPEFWAANQNHNFFDAIAYMLEPMTVLSGISSFVLILCYSRFVTPLKPIFISLILLAIGFLYIIVAWAVLLDVQEIKMIGAFLSIGIQGLLVHATICCVYTIFMLVKDVFTKSHINTDLDITA